MKKLATLILALAAVGCHSQVPAGSVHSVTLTWTAPVAVASWTGCSASAPCSYAIYRCAGTSCPPVPTSSTSWTEITNPAARPTGTSFVDLNVTAGTTYNYTAETVQGTTQSPPSNITTGTIPNTGFPTAPGLGTSPTVATVTPPAMPGVPQPTVAKAEVPGQRMLFAPVQLKSVVVASR